MKWKSKSLVLKSHKACDLADSSKNEREHGPCTIWPLLAWLLSSGGPPGKFPNSSKLPVLYLQTPGVITVTASRSHCKDERKPRTGAQCSGQVPGHSCVTSREFRVLGHKGGEGGGVQGQEDTETLQALPQWQFIALRVAVAVGRAGAPFLRGLLPTPRTPPHSRWGDIFPLEGP